MSEYIKLEDVLKVIENGYCFVPEATWAIRNIPAIDIIRCKECKYCYMSDKEVWECPNGMMITTPNDFCSYGEKR